ncbi:hypothetical protein ACFYQ5_33290 [Streptomyces sp. NPDC005794]|uniref:hypothetical protein n=1 Tax=Streptomyces sp. NPDC005794 TaxID=3364733 RepID=UPI0036A8EDC4
MKSYRTRALLRGSLGFGAALMAAGLSAGAAHADETHTDAHNAPHFALIQTGQIDDPLEDVLEHAAVLGTTYVFD